MSKAKPSVSDTLKNARSVSNVIGDSLADIRETIDDLKTRRGDIEAMPVSLKVALERAHSWAEMQVYDAQQASPSPSYLSLPPTRWNSAYKRSTDSGTAFLAYLGDMFIDAVKNQITEAYEDSQGIDEEQRQDLLTENDREILTAELTEESIIRHAEAHGLAVERRDGADPRAVLAHESALP